MPPEEKDPPQPVNADAGGEPAPTPVEDAWLLPGVYRTAEDAVKAAEEGKRKISEQGQQLSGLQSEVSQYRAYVEQMQSSQAAPEAAQEDEEAFVTTKSLKKMLQDELGRALEPLARTVGRTSLTAMKQEIGADPDYPAIKAEFEAYVNLLPPQALSDPDAIRLAYNAVKGQHADKVFEARQTRQPPARLPGEAVLGRVAGKSGAPMETPQMPLSSEQKRANFMLGIESEEELAKWNNPNYFGPPPVKEGT